MSTYFFIGCNKVTIASISEILNNMPNFTTLGSALSHDDALTTLLKNTPNIIFINIDGGFKNPFAFVTELHVYLNTLPTFVAVSENDKQAYTAIKHGFADYFINPIPELEVTKFALKCSKQQQNQPTTQRPEKTKPQTATALTTKRAHTLRIQSYKDYQFINTNNVVFLKADNNTTDFTMRNGKLITAYNSLKTFENLMPSNFFRIHKSYMVNMNYVNKISYGKLKLSLNDSQHLIPFTKTYVNDIHYITNNLADITVNEN